MADISRDQFNADNKVQKKIFQQGKTLIDADLNESIDISLDNRRRLLSCFSNHVDVRFDDGFKVVATNSSLSVDIKAGNAAFHVDANDELAILIRQEVDYTLTGFSSWVSGGVDRTDLIYIDITLNEYSASDDVHLINPALGVETCRDIRVDWSFAIEENSTTLPTAPSGHVYRELCRITKDADADIIIGNDITLTLSTFRGSDISSMEIPVWTPYSENLTGSDAVSFKSEGKTYYVIAQGVSGTDRSVIKFPYVYDPAHKYLVLYCECWHDANAKGSITLAGGVYGGIFGNIGNEDPTLQKFYFDPAASGAIPGQLYEIHIVLSAANKVGVTGNYKSYFRLPYVAAGLGSYVWD